jgi:predicted Zn-dependent protease
MHQKSNPELPPAQRGLTKKGPHRGKRLLLGLLISLALPATLSTTQASELPVLGDRASATVSLDQEHKMGRAWLKALRSQTREIEDPLLHDYVEHLLYRLAENSQLQDRRLELVVVDNPALNAFAVPGGIVGVNGGLFLYAQTEQEFASVLAHELAHLSQRHYSRAVEAAQRTALPNMAALLASIIVAATVGGDAGIAAISATQAAVLDQQLRFSRENEREADRIGFQTLVNAGMDPKAMASMFERMLMTQRLAGSRPPEFLLTHPVTESRVADARSRAEQLPTHANLVQESLEYQLMRNRVRLAFDEEPSHAIKVFESELDNKNERVKTAAQYGLALAYAKAGQDSKANATLKPLLDSEPNRISYIVAFAEINSRSQSQSDVEALLRKHLALNPDNYALSMALARCLSAKQDYAAARSLLEKISQQRPNDPAVWFKLAEANGFTHNTIGIHLASAEYYILKGNMDQAMQQLDYAYQKSDKSFQLTTLIEKRKADIQAYREELELF